MKRLILLLTILFTSVSAFAQDSRPVRPRAVPTKPGMPCSERDFIQANDTHTASLCQNGVWVDLGGGGTPPGEPGNLIINNSGSLDGVELSGDCVFESPDIICTKTNGVSFAASATTDTTSASNISSGTLAAARGGFGTNISNSSGVPLFSSGTATFTSTSGAGNFARVSSPAFITPSLGVASATSINKVAITSPATSATLAIADGKTLTASNTVTLTGTDGASLNIGAGGSLGSVGGWTDTTTRTLTGSATQYNNLFGMSTAFNGTEGNRQNVVPGSFTLSNLYIRTSSSQPNDGTLTCTVRVNGTTDTSLSVNIPANSLSGTFSDTAHTATLSAGDLVSLKCVNASASTSAGVFDVRFVMVKN